MSLGMFDTKLGLKWGFLKRARTVFEKLTFKTPARQIAIRFWELFCLLTDYLLHKRVVRERVAFSK